MAPPSSSPRSPWVAGGRCADYILTGSWSKKAYKEALKVMGEGAVRCAVSHPEHGFTRLPVAEEVRLDPQAAYLHLCTNETIHGVEVHDARLAAPGVPRWRTCPPTSCRGRSMSPSTA